MVLLVAAALSGCLASPSAPQGLPADAAGAVRLLQEHPFSGSVSGSPATPGMEAFAFEVPAGATEIRAQLTWGSDAAVLGMTLKDPSGEENERGFRQGPTSSAFATVEPPSPGEWTLEVTSTQARDEAFDVAVTVSDAVATAQTIEERYAIPMRVPVRELASLQQDGFAEINLILDEGQSFNYTWASDQTVYFNIHYHDDGATVRAVEENTTSLEGAFTAPFRQVFSLLWRNPGPLPANVETTVGGTFREHSRTQSEA